MQAKTASLKNTLNFLYGFYELSADGTILYARIRYNGKFEKAGKSITGRNFFTDVFNCLNAESFRDCFQDFVAGKSRSQSLIFGCEIYGKVIPLRVTLSRTIKTENGCRKLLYYLDIKPA